MPMRIKSPFHNGFYYRYSKQIIDVIEYPISIFQLLAVEYGVTPKESIAKVKAFVSPGAAAPSTGSPK